MTSSMLPLQSWTMNRPELPSFSMTRLGSLHLSSILSFLAMPSGRVSAVRGAKVRTNCPAVKWWLRRESLRCKRSRTALLSIVADNCVRMSRRAFSMSVTYSHSVLHSGSPMLGEVSWRSRLSSGKLGSRAKLTWKGLHPVVRATEVRYAKATIGR